MEDKLVLNRIARPVVVVASLETASVVTSWLARNFLAGVHAVMLKAFVFPFLLAGISMRPLDADAPIKTNEGIMANVFAVLTNAMVYLIPYSVGYAAFRWEKSRVLLLSIWSKLNVWWSASWMFALLILATLFQFGLLYFQGFIQLPVLIETIAAPQDYMATGRTIYVVIALFYNPLIALLYYLIIRFLILSTRTTQ